MSDIYELTEQQKEIQDLAWQIALRDIKPIRESFDEQEKFPWDVVKKMAAADLYSVYLPEAYGGMGGGLKEQVLVIEQLSRACGGIALAFAASGLGVLPILLLGNPEQRARFIPDLASGKKLAAFSITEANAGSDATATECTAKLDGEHYILNGSKTFVSNGEVAETYVVFATTNRSRGARGVTAFVVEKGTPGFGFGKKEHKMGIRANPTYQLDFTNCRVPVKNRLYKEGYGLFTAQTTFDCSRPGVAAQALGIAQGALDETMAYIRQRRQFGQPISSFQAIQHMMANCATQIEMSRALLYTTANAMDKYMLPVYKKAIDQNAIVYDVLQAGDGKRWTKESAMCKLSCSDTAMFVTNECVQMCGGIGYMRDFPVEKYMRDAKITQIYEGTNQIQRNEIAAMMIKELASATKPEAVAA
ncbi:MAG: acyl-CoA dehydrogenase family protein [Elusimicrobiota bacterium]|nr:acyl-CoA dehydrogenase family protein [Elusimicrobiota bacterium]